MYLFKHALPCPSPDSKFRLIFSFRFRREPVIEINPTFSSVEGVIEFPVAVTPAPPRTEGKVFRFGGNTVSRQCRPWRTMISYNGVLAKIFTVPDTVLLPLIFVKLV